MPKEKENLNGAIADPRTPEEKSKDYDHQECLGSAITVLNWIEKTSWTTLSLRKQSTSSSCGAQSGAKILEAFKFITMSATPPYRFRQNYPSEGMYLQNIGDILKNKKTTTENLCISQNLDESQMNAALVPTDLPHGISGYYTLLVKDSLDMDLLATALEKGHGLIIGISSNGQEWTDVPKFNGHATTFNHFVACVPKNYTLHQGEQSVIIDDSCNAFSSINGTGQRILTYTFLKQRCWGILALVPEVGIDKPIHTFNVDLKKGMKGNEVKLLQQCLIYGKFLRSGFDTGYFGDLTDKAVISFQETYFDEILKPAGLIHGTGYVGSLTRKKLNSLYSS